jgi:3'-5' exoribonuclease
MAAQRRVGVGELVEGLSVDEVFLVKDASMRSSRNGKNYIAAQLADATGSITTRMWDAQPGNAAGFRAGSFIRVRGHVESYQGALQLVVTSFRPVEQKDVDLGAFMATTPRDLAELESLLLGLVDSVADAPLKALLDSYFRSEEFMARFRRSPAASEYHHAYVGGLMEHSVCVAQLAARMAEDRSGELDRDLLLTGALLHDIGKAYELTAGPTFDYTDPGRLVGHIVMGCIETDKRMAALPDFPVETRRQVLHLIASHHGQREFGSPVLPATPEALALHHLDNLDAKVRASVDAAPQAADESWSDFQRMLGVRIYKRRRPVAGS